MHVVFVEPAVPTGQREFVRALVQAGVRVSAVGTEPVSSLDGELRRWLAHYEQVASTSDPTLLAEATERIGGHLRVDRLEATLQAHVLAAAQARDELGLGGTSPRTARLCHDRAAMKEVLRAGGVPCSASLGSDSAEEILAFAERIGFPLAVKPRAAAGVEGTTRIDGMEELLRAFDRFGIGRGGEVAVESFYEGHEAFYDTITIGRRVAHEFITHCYPTVLEARRTRWISPQLLTTNRIETAPGYQPVLEMGRKVNRLLGVDTSATHLEWFFGPEGHRFSEIACRPPRVRAWELYAIANDIDVHLEWATAVAWGRTVRKASRRLSAGVIALRPDRDGVIAGHEGADEVWRRFGSWIIDAHLPPAGTPTRPVESGYMANAWIRMKHPDYDTLKSIMDEVGEIFQTRAR
jgi:carbamoylphosphate synthase large subunit